MSPSLHHKTSYLFLGQQLALQQVPLTQQAICYTALREVGEVEPATHPLGGPCALGVLAAVVQGEVEGMGPLVRQSSAGLELGEGDHLVQECCGYCGTTAHMALSTITEYYYTITTNTGQ